MLSVSLEISLNVRNQKNRKLTLLPMPIEHTVRTAHLKYELKFKEGVSCGHVYHVAC